MTILVMAMPLVMCLVGLLLQRWATADRPSPVRTLFVHREVSVPTQDGARVSVDLRIRLRGHGLHDEGQARRTLQRITQRTGILLASRELHHAPAEGDELHLWAAAHPEEGVVVDQVRVIDRRVLRHPEMVLAA